ncbi:MAG TPA: efflux RND transporter periplasmic adaptor subunit [Polyangiaceae bacterium]|jgi:membrane fusion protein (multidrug efflux system)|nr:efflux RND transporter periplasmic adaptor subunit [Polyangiaceae bacterium]
MPVPEPISKPRRAGRVLLVVLGLLILVGGLGFIKFSQIAQLMAMGKAFEKSGPPPESVSSATAEMQNWQNEMTAVGSIAPVRGVALSNDLPGIVTKINFESGDVVKEGQVLVELDTSVERAQLASAVVRHDLAVVNVNRSHALIKENVISQSQVDSDESTVKSAATDAASLQATINRKIVRAPFAGRLGIREVNIGQYLNPGTQLTVLQAIGAVFVDFSLPQQELSTMTVGLPVKVKIEDANMPLIDGAIAAVDPTIDSNTRMLKLRASVPNPGEKLRPGMFADVAVELPGEGAVVTVPVTAIVHASFGDSVFIVEDKKPDSPGAKTTPDGKIIKNARQQFVRVGESRGDFVAIVDGVKSGDEVVTAGAFKLRNNSPILVNNSVKPEPQLDPHPENH